MSKARPGADAINPASDEEAIEVGPGMWMSHGLSNSYLVSTDAGRIIVNTGVPFESLLHRQLFDAVDSSPTIYIVVTQGHPDHFGGVDTFKEPGTDVIAQANWPTWRDEHYLGRLDGFRARAGFAWQDKLRAGMALAAERFGRPLPSLSDPEPTISVDKFLSLDAGGRRFEFHATPGGETTDSMIVWLPEDRTCFTGNLFGPLFGHLPNLVTLRGDRYRDPALYLQAVDLVRSLRPERLITGHFDPVVGEDLIDDELRRMGDAVRFLLDETIRGMNEGRDVYALMRDIKVPSSLQVGEGYGKASWNVRAIWEMYAGWFHHRSTTELYGIPTSAVFGDLVEMAGGPRVLVERAAKLLARGQAVEAIHLLDIVRTGEAGGARANEVYAAAHRALLELATNFWERAWLSREIELAENRT